MYNMIREQSILAMELPTPFSPIIHSAKAMGSLLYLDGNYCAGKLMSQVKSALIILLEMKLGNN